MHKDVMHGSEEGSGCCGTEALRRFLREHSHGRSTASKYEKRVYSKLLYRM